LLLAAEDKAIKSTKGMHDKKNIPTRRIADITGDVTKSKQFLPFLQRAGRMQVRNLHKFSTGECEKRQWVETNPYNIRIRTSIFIALWYYANGMLNTEVRRENTDVTWVCFHPPCKS
jgi:hypothetical protein